jgi:phage N-6-adenine-methyltransferase
MPFENSWAQYPPTENVAMPTRIPAADLSALSAERDSHRNDFANYRWSTPATAPTIIPGPMIVDASMTAEDLVPTEESRAYIPRAVRSDWRTPDSVVSVVRQAFGGEVDLDPCASTTHWLEGGDEIGEELNFHEEDDGLNRDWGKRTVFVNPPFNHNRDWVKKCAEEAAKGAEVILLIPARTDTLYWHNLIAKTSGAICFWRGRITFVGAPNTAPFPCAFVYWGPNAARFDDAFAVHGQVLYTNNPVPVTRSEV